MDTDTYGFIVTAVAWLVVLALGYFRRRANASGPSPGSRALISRAGSCLPVTIAANGRGVPCTIVTSGGLPVVGSGGSPQ
jgi:hypothetical protein